MGVALTILLNALLIASLVLFLVMLFNIVLRGTERPVERVIRAGALFTGAIIVVGSQTSGASYADFIADSLAGTRPLTFGIAGIVAPGLLGAGLGWYFVRAVERSETIAIRVLALVGMLAAMQFITLYGVMLKERGFSLGAAALPNIAFVSGIFIYLMLKYDPDAKTARTSRFGSLADRIGGRRGAKAEAPANPFAPSEHR